MGSMGRRVGGSMSIRSGGGRVLSSSAFGSLCCGLGGFALAKTPGPPPAPEAPQAQPAQNGPGTLPTINVETSKKKPAKKQAEPRQQQQPVQPTAETQQAIAERQTQAQVTTFNTARN